VVFDSVRIRASRRLKSRSRGSPNQIFQIDICKRVALPGLTNVISVRQIRFASNLDFQTFAKSWCCNVAQAGSTPQTEKKSVESDISSSRRNSIGRPWSLAMESEAGYLTERSLGLSSPFPEKEILTSSDGRNLPKLGPGKTQAINFAGERAGPRGWIRCVSVVPVGEGFGEFLVWGSDRGA